MEEMIKKCLPTYQVLRKIGEGIYGSVYHVKDSLKERAVKVVPIMVERSLSFRTEQELDSKISHDFHAVQDYYGKLKGEGVIEIHDFHLVGKTVSKQEAKAHLVILMELCPENLSDHVLDFYPLTPKQAKKLMRELAEVLNRLSNRTEDAFIVKDLKPANLLISKEDKLLIGDLGGLQRLHSVSTTTKGQFTPNWSAPELIINSENANVPSLMYSYGLVCYFIWFGKLPYEKMDFIERTKSIKNNGLIFTRSDMPYYIQGMIEKCLKFNPAHRPENFNNILKVLSGSQPLVMTDPAASQGSRSRDSDSKEQNSRGSRSTGYRSVGTQSGGTRSSGYRSSGQKSTGSRSSGSGPAVSKSRGSKSNGYGNGKFDANEDIGEITVDRLEVDTNLPSGRHKIGDRWKEPITNMEFAWVPSGSFRMGSGKWAGKGKNDELPAHTVHVDGFWMGRFLVTQDLWKKVMANTFWRKVTSSNPAWFKMGPDYPIEQVSWNEAQEFIQKLIAFNKEKYHFRLPTEAEWEYAARSCGKNEKYSGGNQLNRLAWYSVNSSMTSQPVGKKQPNKLGLYDMSGNVYEWCLDLYSETAYKRHQKKNPLTTNKGHKRVIRGGSWCNSPHEMRSTYRASVNQDFKGNYLGFRVVMTSVSRKKFDV